MLQFSLKRRRHHHGLTECEGFSLLSRFVRSRRRLTKQDLHTTPEVQQTVQTSRTEDVQQKKGYVMSLQIPQKNGRKAPADLVS